MGARSVASEHTRYIPPRPHGRLRAVLGMAVICCRLGRDGSGRGPQHGAGRAYVFEDGATGWPQVAELAGSGTATGDLFGGSVTVSGGTAVVSAYHGNDASRAYVFQESG